MSRVQTITFLKCRSTGHVSFVSHGYVFWSPCEECGWTNNDKTVGFSEHWELTKVKLASKEYNALFKTENGFSDWVDKMVASLKANWPS